MINLNLITTVIIGILSGWVAGFVIIIGQLITEEIIKEYNIKHNWRILLIAMISGIAILFFISILLIIS